MSTTAELREGCLLQPLPSQWGVELQKPMQDCCDLNEVVVTEKDVLMVMSLNYYSSKDTDVLELKLLLDEDIWYFTCNEVDHWRKYFKIVG